ncbi:hypothetical protein B0A55_03174 [Friedmanniomyces simplex]|uniref:Uncharacterized protein n=1 Tax=Friedmanniomyces simplex TaxID=329884 RepID=A0A4U0XJX0_9PEZI|nr:hypothetical protein B0A55_03174 [Friedmanniomyces simplex]
MAQSKQGGKVKKYDSITKYPGFCDLRKIRGLAQVKPDKLPMTAKMWRRKMQHNPDPSA